MDGYKAILGTVEPCKYPLSLTLPAILCRMYDVDLTKESAVDEISLAWQSSKHANRLRACLLG